MSEDVDLAIDKAQETIEEKRREAAHAPAEGGRPRWLEYLAMSTALFAVLAAVAALEAGNYANEALFQANKGVLLQAAVVDTWSQYQAESLKKYEQLNLITVLKHIGGTPAEFKQATAEAARRQQQQDVLRRQATALTAQTEETNRAAERQMEFHHRFALSVTLFQVAIGLSAIAALLCQRLVWYVSLAAGFGALLTFINGFTATFRV